MTVSPSDFPAFFRAIHGYDPFPWQRMLAERVATEGWPDCLDLPTGSGKTACLDISVFSLACQSDRLLANRTATRRVFFVVDRRIVVDAAYTRARGLATALHEARDGIVADVAARLLSLHGGDRPLVAARMRGGIARDDGWIRSPAQPAIITGTVDQVGSRLLFRAYGPGLATAPIHAALVANDSLILLDEAHCAVPFYQTATSVARYRQPEWSKEPIASPFRLVVMSATPPEGAAGVWPSPTERNSALDHPKLQQRLTVGKPAELAVARAPKSPKKGDTGLRGTPVGDDELVADAADRAVRLVAEGRQRVAIMVNRVRTARSIHQQLLAETRLETHGLDADVILLTGRMRPLDRDVLVNRWETALGASDPQPVLERPAIVVTTQCLEVGADYSFDALITECASLDALRQRFGRLDRLGTVANAAAVILTRKAQIKEEEKLQKLDEDDELDDPIYGNALARTWNWLMSVPGEDGDKRVVDFGVAALDRTLPPDQTERKTLLERLNAPSPDAPVLLPSHLDCWVQTAPPPTPDPDPAIFLHGPNRGEPEVSIVLRADLPEDDIEKKWPEIASFAPPSSFEALSVPLRVARKWMQASEDDPGGDVEGAMVDEEERDETRGRRSALIWKGRDDSTVTKNPHDLRPNQVLLIPSSEAGRSLGDIPSDGRGRQVMDIGDQAVLEARGQVRLRIHKAVLAPWGEHPAIVRLLAWTPAEDGEDDQDLTRIFESIAAADSEEGLTASGPVALPGWLRTVARALAAESKGRTLVKYPGSGWVVNARTRSRLGTEGKKENPTSEEGAMADGDDLTSESCAPVGLGQHLDDVAQVAARFAAECLPEPYRPTVEQAARLHDLGKADWRFQLLLHQGNEIAAHRRGMLLAKSEAIPATRSGRERARRLSGIPRGFRHEMLSMELAERTVEAGDGNASELLLHLIASHHGHARPFAPVVIDLEPPGVDLRSIEDAPAGLDAAARRGSIPAHRLDSGVADRFWRLTRRFGWWGLGYLEAILRLADWEASEQEARTASKTTCATEVA